MLDNLGLPMMGRSSPMNQVIYPRHRSSRSIATIEYNDRSRVWLASASRPRDGTLAYLAVAMPFTIDYIKPNLPRS
jgi:hypothetical protein